MKLLGNKGAGPCSEGDYLISVKSYFEQRAHWGNLHSEFSCDAQCMRPGCKNRSMHIPVSVFDLIGASLFLGTPVDELFRRCYSLGITTREGHIWIVQVSVKLNKPCHFLESGKCTIYPVRPLACILFPESYSLNGTLETLREKAVLKEYHCLRKHIPMSEDRRKIVRKLDWLMKEEFLVTDYYLFGGNPFLIDFSSMEEDLLQEAEARPVSRGAEGSLNEIHEMDGPCISIVEMESAFDRIFKPQQPFREVQERIVRMRDVHVQQELFEYRRSPTPLNKLWQSRDDRFRIFHLSEGKVAVKRRTLVPADQLFVW